MRCQGIRGASRSKKRFTTKSDPDHVRAPDLVNRNFSASRPDELEAVAHALNTRPRKTLGWKTPAEVFNDHLLSLQQAGVASTD